MARLDQLDEQPIDLEGFATRVGHPRLQNFCADISAVYQQGTEDRSGRNAGSIPIPQDAAPLTHALSHQCVGVEPSGRPFNALDLLPHQRNFNPCLNAGAK
jgi:hypothetical protein